MTKRRAVLLATALFLASVAPAFGAASIQITDPQDQDFVNTGAARRPRSQSRMVRRETPGRNGPGGRTSDL